MAVVDAPTDVTIQMIGEGLRGARQDIHDLKTFVMGMEDRINERFDGIDGRLDGIDGRLDGIDAKLDKVIAHLENGS